MKSYKARMFLFCLFFCFFTASSALSADYVTIQLDPPDRLSGATVLGEWNTAGNLETWTGTNISGLQATGGYLTGTGSAAAPSVQKQAFSGPDLDFGFFDYLQIRIKVPASFADDIIFSFGTSVNNGFAANREFKIPDANIPNDGQWHTYRIDVGLVVWWRDSLRDLQIKPLGNSGNGQTFYIDYVEVGDLPGDVLIVNTDVGLASGETLADTSRMESKHAVFWWSPASFVIDSQLNPSVMGRRALRMIEESYQVYCKKLGYVEPFESWDLWRRDGNRYKVNHTTWFGGFWMGGRNGFGWLNVPAGGLWDEGWGNPVPHEFGHVLDGHQIYFLTGGHWESHANFLRQSWQLHYAARFPADQQSQLDLQIYECSNFRQDHGRLIYRDFRIHQALADFADDLGLDYNIVAKLWFTSPVEKTVYEKLQQLMPPGYDVGNVVAFGLRHWPFLDFADGTKFKNQLWSNATNKAWHDYLTGSLLIPCQDKPGWFRAPFERAPEKFAYMYHQLVPTDSNVTVEFQGFDLLGSTEGWRWSLAAVNTSGVVRYSDVWTPGTHSFVLAPSETKLYLVVVPAPSDTSLLLDYTDNRFPPDKCAERLHYAYEVSITGAVPASADRQLNITTASGHAHSNGGGWVANTATVNATAYVGPHARVLNTAKVYNYARIEDYAIVMTNATVRDNAVVSGYAVVTDSAIIRNNAKVRDRGVVSGSAIIEGNAAVEDYAHIYDSTNIKNSAIARGLALGVGNAVISETSIADYDLTIGHSISNGVHFSHVPWGDWYIPYFVNTKVKPRGLVASYRIEEPEGQVCWDEFGAQHALLRGNPQRIIDTQMNSKVLRLNGTSQYAVLDRSLCDFVEGSFSLWFNPNGNNTNKPLLFMGGASDTYLKIAARDDSGHAKVTVSYQGTPLELASTSIVPADQWTHIAVVFNSDTSCNLYINGILEDTEWAVNPDILLGSNDFTTGEAYYIGRDWSGNLFAGDVEDIRFYNVALTQAEIENELRRTGDVIGAFYYNSPQDFDGTITTAESGVHNGLERALEASIYPDTSDDVSYYEGVLDCTDETNGGFEGSGFGLDNREILVRLDNVGFWRTGVLVTLGQWQKIVVAFNGSNAELFVNDQLKASRTYSASANDVAGKNYRIGFAMDTSSNKYYFDGRIKDVFIYDRFNNGDNQPPSPDPAQWAIEPYTISKTQITMTAVTGSDTSGTVEYYFDETSGNPGGSDSLWQTSPAYTDTGLQSGTAYSYTVKMRDRYNNETAPSSQAQAQTFCLSDFNNDGIVDACDLQIFTNDWLVEYEPAHPALIGQWNFDENSGTTAYDSIGTNHAAVNGGAAMNGSGYITLDGSNDYAIINRTISTDFTIAFFVKTTDTASTGQWYSGDGLVDGEVGGVTNDFGTALIGNKFGFGVGNPDTTITSTTPINDGDWHHVAATRNAVTGAMKVYVDGVMENSTTGPTGAKTSPSKLRIGCLQTNIHFLSGSIDRLDIFNTVLSDAEIAQLAAGSVPGSQKETDLYPDNIINFLDFAIFAQCY